METAIVLSNTGLARLFSGDLDHARDAFERALRLRTEGALDEVADESLAGLAADAAAQGRYEMAARLRGVTRAFGYPPASFDKRIDDRLERDYLATARARYGDVAWRHDEQAGAEMSREHAIAYALGERDETIQRQAAQDGAQATATNSSTMPSSDQPPREAPGVSSTDLRR